ncbi:MAG: PAS domain S-box protein [Syntrophorhabdus aromaticivorans]|uniref:histidine kinase n=1 Tax=Syntrophorhabdus aromaticivorans TaxID=328301 RepID=A0A971S158_9BACT|nr:PAS domain S-box protein [Syntrophorhabdus aromaticivorans]
MDEHAAGPGGAGKQRSKTVEGRRGTTGTATEGQTGCHDFVTNNPEGIWRLECKEPVPVDLPEDEQIDRFFRYARLADCNDAVARMYGFEKRDDLIGVLLMDISPGSQQRNIELIRSFVRSGYRLEDGELYEADRFGDMHCFLMNALAFIEDGCIRQIWGTHRDITEWKRSEQRAKESEQELRAILSASPIGIVRVKNRVVDWANESMSRITGYTVEELKGKDLCTAYVSDEEYERVGAVLYREGQCKAQYVRKDGSIVDAHVQLSPVDNDSYIVTVTDITHQKQIKDALQFTQFAVDSALDGILWIRKDGALHYVNDGLCRSTGYAREELLSMTIHDIDPDFPEKPWNDLWSKARNLGPLVFETHHRRKDRTVFPVEVSINFLMYDGIDYACAFARDITGRKRAETKIAQAAQEWQATFDAITDTVMIIDGECRIARVNKAAEVFFNRPARMIVGARCFALMDGTEQPPGTCPFAKMRSTKKTVTTERYDRSRGIWLSLSLDPILDNDGNVTGAVYIGKDITDRKLSEDVLRESEKKFRDLAEESGVGVYVLQDGIFKYVNKRLAAIGGWGVDEVIEKTGPRDWAYPEDLPRVEENIRKRISGEIESLHYEFRIVTANKEIRDAEVYGTRTIYQGRPALIGTLLDITDRKRVEAELQHERETFFTILQHHPFGIAQIDWKGTHLYINPAFTKITGYTLEDVPTAEEWFRRAYPDPDYRKEVIASWERTGLIKEGSTDAAYRIMCKDGKKKDIEFRATYMKDYRVVVFHDVTELQRLESQLRHAQKMEAVGQLAGGIAHDFNNILTAIMGYGNLLQMKISESDPLKLYADKILAVAQKAANLTQSLLAFSRKQVIELRPHKVDIIIQEVEKLLERLLTEDINLEVVFCGRDLTVLADITQIDQVLLNLVTNARDAMPKGGKLRIETGKAVLGEEFRRTHGYGEPGEYALISVSDSGIGIDDKVRERIFEPFFTTKEIGYGTGLGLSIVYGIVKQHNGYIDFHSEQGRGTVFHVYLPITGLQAEEEISRVEETGGGMETILVAEDNHDVRELIVSILSDKGYTLVEAVDGKDAVEKFMKYKDTITLAVLDVVMPRKNGKEVHREIKQIRPDIKVLFTSGYTGDVVLGKGVRDGALNFISKPLSPGQLLLKVREILDKDG